MPAILRQGSATHGWDAESCGRMEDRPWFCVWTKPNQERLANHELRAFGFPTYLPLHVPERSRSGLIELLFPRYLFAQPNDDGQWVKMLFQRGVANVLRNPMGRPKVVPTDIVDQFLSQCAPNGIIYPPEPEMLHVKQPGRVTMGPFAEFTGICSRAAKDRVWLLLSVMGRQTEIGFARNAVEVV